MTAVNCTAKTSRQRVLMRGNLGDNFIIGFEGTAMSAVLRALLTRVQPAGVVLFRRNIASAEQTWELHGRRNYAGPADE